MNYDLQSPSYADLGIIHKLWSPISILWIRRLSLNWISRSNVKETLLHKSFNLRSLIKFLLQFRANLLASCAIFTKFAKSCKIINFRGNAQLSTYLSFHPLISSLFIFILCENLLKDISLIRDWSNIWTKIPN